MRFESIGLGDACLVHLNPHRDNRGFFSRHWCLDSFRAAGIDLLPVQANYSLTLARGAIRGMHFQGQPKPDAKLVRCTQGRMFEVVADMRAGSPTWGCWRCAELSEDGFCAMYVPAGFAQGFQSLTKRVVVEYLMGERYDPAFYCGFRFNDPVVGIKWPLPVAVVSDQDQSWPPLYNVFGAAAVASSQASAIGTRVEASEIQC